MPKARVYLALLHYPVYNKRMDIVNTSVTNLDIHDIARSSATYGLEGYYIVQPLKPQRLMVERIIAYWNSGQGHQYNPDRQKAIEKVKVCNNFDTLVKEVEVLEGDRPQVVVTDARTYPKTVSYKQMRDLLSADGVYILLFGTGWGIAKETMEKADWILEPIYGYGSYNHLSVRSAAAIILDRLLGEKWW